MCSILVASLKDNLIGSQHTWMLILIIILTRRTTISAKWKIDIGCINHKTVLLLMSCHFSTCNMWEWTFEFQLVQL